MNPIVIASGNFLPFQEKQGYPGTYMISGNYESESVSQPIYIGSSQNVFKRINAHFLKLEKNKNHNPILQNSYNKYGKEGFTIWLLETCKKEECITVEQKYLDFYRPYLDERRGFNMCKLASSNAGIKFSEEVCRKRSESRRGEKHHFWGKKMPREYVERSREARKGQKLTEEHKKRIGDALRGEKSPQYGKPLSEEVKRKISETKLKAKNRKPPGAGPPPKFYRFLSPNGVIHEGWGISTFCKRMNLDEGNMRRVMAGKYKQCYGWRLP